MIWETVRDLLITAMAAAISENLVFVRAFSLGELDYEEYTIRRGLRDSRIVTLMCLLAAVSGWAGRQVIDRWFPLPPHLRPSVFLAIFATLFLCIMGGVLLARKKRGKETSKKRYKFHTAIAFGFLPMGVLLVAGFGNGGLVTSLVGAAGSGAGYLLAMLLCWTIRERLDFCDIPKAFRGAPILFIYLGLISLALFGLVGHQLAL